VAASLVATVVCAGVVTAAPAKADAGGYEQQALLGMPSAFYTFEDTRASGAISRLLTRSLRSPVATPMPESPRIGLRRDLRQRRRTSQA
jgi:hypothetical protein